MQEDQDDIVKIGVTLVEARNLKNMDMPIFGRNDAYAVVKVGENKFKTKVKKNAGKEAFWDETFHFTISPKDEMLIEVWDEDMINDDLIGFAKLNTKRIFSEGSLEGWFPIFSQYKTSGEVHIRIHYIP